MGGYFAEMPFDKRINIISVSIMATASLFNLIALCIFYAHPSKMTNAAKIVFNIFGLTYCISRLSGLMFDSQTECSVGYPQSISIGLFSELIILLLFRKLLEFKGKHDGIFFDSFGVMIVVFKVFVYFLYAVIQLYVTRVTDGCKFRSGQVVLLGINMLDLLTDIYVGFRFVRYITDIRRRQEKQEIRSSKLIKWDASIIAIATIHHVIGLIYLIVYILPLIFLQPSSRSPNRSIAGDVLQAITFIALSVVITLDPDIPLPLLDIYYKKNIEKGQ